MKAPVVEPKLTGEAGRGHRVAIIVFVFLLPLSKADRLQVPLEKGLVAGEVEGEGDAGAGSVAGHDG